MDICFVMRPRYALISCAVIKVITHSFTHPLTHSLSYSGEAMLVPLLNFQLWYQKYNPINDLSLLVGSKEALMNV